jgi:hypothetical protein
MKIEITHSSLHHQATHVKFHSPFGNGIGVWRGIAPKLGELLDVELDIDEVFSWRKNIMPSSRKSPLITVINGTTHITAELIPGTSDECAALKLGDSIVLIELDGPLTQTSGFVELNATQIYLYTTGI